MIVSNGKKDNSTLSWLQFEEQNSRKVGMSAPRVSSLEIPKCKTRTYMVLIKDYDHMTTMNENVNWMKPTHLLSNFANLRAPFCTSTFTSQKPIAFLDVHTKEK